MPIIKNTQLVNGQETVIYVDIEEFVEPVDEYYEDLRETGLQRAAERVIEVSEDVFGAGLKLVNDCAVRIVDSIDEMDKSVRPDEYSAEFSILLSGGIAHIVAAKADAQMRVSMKWCKSPV